MSDKTGHTKSALKAWASTVMSGGDAADTDRVGEVDRAPGHASYDPADVINVFMSARESARQRNQHSRGEDSAQPS